MALGTFVTVLLQLALNVGVAIVLSRLLGDTLGVSVDRHKVVLLLCTL